MTRWYAAGASEQGLRERNEDGYGIDLASGVFAIADGMGGLSAGHEASKLAIDTVVEHALDLRVFAESDIHGVLRDRVELTLREASQRVYRLGKRHGRTMGTTLTMVCLRDASVVVGHVGDSRLYRVRGPQVTCLTEDHTLAHAHLKTGLFTPEEARASDLRNVLIECIGPRSSIEPDLSEVPIEEGDALVLCSDGVWAHLDDETIAAYMALPPHEAARGLVAKALERGSDDNCTAVVVHVGAPEVRAVKRLGVSELFVDVDDQIATLLEPYVESRLVPEGAVLLEEGQDDPSMYVIARGAVEISRGGEPLARLSSGRVFGEIPVPRVGPRTTRAAAVLPTEVLVVDHGYLGALRGMQPSLAEYQMERFLATVARSSWRPS